MSAPCASPPAMKGLHYVLHAPQGDTYADLLFTMIERREPPPAGDLHDLRGRDLGEDTAGIFKKTCQDAYDRFKPQALIVGASCTAELIQDDPGGLAETMGLPVPGRPAGAAVLPAQGELRRGRDVLPARPRAGAADGEDAGGDREPDRPARAGLPPSRRHRGGDRACSTRWGSASTSVAPFDATPQDLTRLGAAHVNVLMYPEHAETAARWMERTLGIPYTKTVPDRRRRNP
jgi:light-independent protochlorophyllide reductase subunit B